MEIAYLCDERFYRGRSRYQRIDIVNSCMYGRMLFLDGVAQSAENDEFVYHEMLVHPALFSCESPASVLLIGGAEGATLREVLRHPGVRRVVMVEIDGELVEICKRHLPQWHQRSFEDPRLELIIGDGRRYVEQARETFDAIIVDLSDPLEGSPALYLFTREFYALIKKCLAPGGCAAFQGEGISPPGLGVHARMVHTLRQVFPKVLPYPYFLHSFHRPDAHILATLDPRWSPKLLASRMESMALPLRYLTPAMARGIFSLPAYLSQAYRQPIRLLTDRNVREVDEELHQLAPP